MKIKHLPLVALLPLAYVSASASTLFSDGFESGLSNWTVSSATKLTVVSTVFSEGSNSLQIVGGGTPTTRTLTLNNALSLAAGGDLTISFDYKAGNANGFEAADGLSSFQVNLGSGYTTVLTDFGAANGTTSTYSGTPITLASTAGAVTGFVNYTITIPETYYTSVSATTVLLKFNVITGADDEIAYLDNVNVSLASIPEPSSYALLAGVAGVMVALVRRRKSV